MRRVISAALAMVMVMAISIPAFAIDKEREVSRLAYMNLDQASEAMQEKILQAREEIIFSKSWVADGLQGLEGRITLKTKTIRVIRSFNTRF